MSTALARQTFEWTDYEEGILTETVNAAESTKKGLQEASDKLGTTFYICRNHWYKNILPKYAEEPVKDIRNSLESLINNLSRLVDENARITKELTKVTQEKDSLIKENTELKSTHDVILKIMDKARKMSLLDEESVSPVYTIKDGAVSFQTKG